MSTDFLDLCDCGEKVKITKQKLDIEKGIIYVISDEEIEIFRHNKKCPSCIKKYDSVNYEKEDKVWSAWLLRDDDDHRIMYFKDKNSTIDYILSRIKAKLSDENNYCKYFGSIDANFDAMIHSYHVK